MNEVGGECTPPASAEIEPASMAELRILALGDSITDGGLKMRAYRYHLHVELGRDRRAVRWLGSMQGVYDRKIGRNATSGVVLPDEADWPAEAQHHEGHWGWTAGQLLRGHERQPQRDSLAPWLERLTPSPHAILLHIGTNDLTKHVMKEGKPVSSVASHVSSILRRVCRGSPASLVLLASIIPHCRGGEGAIQRRREVEAEYNGRLAGLCERHFFKPPAACPKMRLKLVNLTAVVSCSMLVDGIHPGPQGARNIASALLEKLRPHYGQLTGA